MSAKGQSHHFAAQTKSEAVLPKSIAKRGNQHWAAARKSAPDEGPLQSLNPLT
jgi:hypothetical protein